MGFFFFISWILLRTPIYHHEFNEQAQISNKKLYAHNIQNN